MRSYRYPRIGSCLLVFVSLLLVGCNLNASRYASVWLDVPVDGLSLPDVQAIKIEGHASGAGGISRVEVWAGGTLVTTIDNPPLEGDLASFHMEWTPPAAGTYTIQAVAYGRDGSTSAPDSARVTFGGPTPTLPVGCPSPVGGGPTPPPPCPSIPLACPSPVGGGPTPPPPCPSISMACPSPVGGGPTPVTCAELPVVTVITPGAEVQFWAEPESITAGACTQIRWHASNVRSVVFGGTDQPLDGSYEACLCDDERYSLIVTYLDGREERRTLDVPVEGECVTEVPADTTPPPVPQPVVPANGLTLSCRSQQTLAWLPVEDPSGIAEYRVQLTRHSGDGNWAQAPGSPTASVDKEATFNVECGWYYQWIVKAIDGAGNASPYSDFSSFTITLE